MTNTSAAKTMAPSLSEIFPDKPPQTLEEALALISLARQSLVEAEERIFAEAQRADQAEVRAREAENDSLTDDLTGLSNRRYLMFALDKTLREIQRDPKKQAAIFFIDLDDFGQINKKYGDVFGDKALAEVGRRLRGFKRVNEEAIRKGGDEFAIVVMSDIYDKYFPDRVGTRLKESLIDCKILGPNGEIIKVKASIGCRVFGHDATKSGIDVDQLLYEVDQMMRTKKAARKLAKIQGATPDTETLRADLA